MIGQEKILKKIEESTWENLPQSLLITGDLDDYQEEVVDKIVEKLQVPKFDITESISLDLIMIISQSSVPGIYYIDLTKITEKEQNVILKFLEEPPEMAKLILLTTKQAKILNTIKNRCVEWKLAGYSQELINTLTSDPYVQLYAKTPKQVELYSKIDIKGVAELCNSVIRNISRARFSNCLVITNKIAFKAEDSGYPVLLFFNVLRMTILDIGVNNGYDEFIKLCDLYKLSLNVESDMIEFPLINREWLFNNFLLQAKQVMMV